MRGEGKTCSPQKLFPRICPTGDGSMEGRSLTYNGVTLAIDPYTQSVPLKKKKHGSEHVNRIAPAFGYSELGSPVIFSIA